MSSSRPMRRPLRVGFVIDELHPGAGTENQLILLLQHFDRSVLLPFLFCLRNSPDLDRLNLGCESRVLGISSLSSVAGLRASYRFSRFMLERELDVLVTFFRDANLVGSLAAVLAGLRVIASRRNIGYWHDEGELRLLRAVNGIPDGFVANSQAARVHAIRTEGIRPSRIQVVHNALDTERFVPLRSEDKPVARRALGLVAGWPVLACVANLRQVKGHQTLLRAFREIRTALGQARLLLVGDGPEREVLERLAHELRISDAVDFLGNRDDIPQLLRSVDLGVLGSLSESFSNALLEYMACGLPTVSTAVGGWSELILPGESGCVVPAGESEALARSVIQLSSEPDRMKRIGSAARRSVQQKFSIPVVLERWYDVLSAGSTPLTRASVA